MAPQLYSVFEPERIHGETKQTAWKYKIIIGHNFGNVRVKLVIGTVDRVEGTLDEVVVVIGEVWHVHIGVLKPNMEREEGKKSERVNRVESRNTG